MGTEGGLWDPLDVLFSTRLNRKTVYIGAAEPSTFYPGMFWYDTSADMVKIRNAANTGWTLYQRLQLYVADETEVLVTGTSEVERKSHLIVKSSSHGRDIQKINVLAEMRVSAASTGTLRVYVDGVQRIVLTTTSTSYELKKGSWTISPVWGEDSIHTISIRLLNSTTQSTYNRLYELYIE